MLINKTIKPILFLLLFAISNSLTAQFVSVNWTGNGDGTTWNDPANWSTQMVPETNNRIFFKGDVTVSGEVSNNPAQIVIRDSSTVVLDLDITIESDSFACLSFGNISNLTLSGNRTYNLNPRTDKVGIFTNNKEFEKSLTIGERATINVSQGVTGINMLGKLGTITNNGIKLFIFSLV